MITEVNKNCLDANVLIQAWQKYYNPRFCPDYWVVLNELGKQNIIFIPELVREEIIRTDDDLSEWLKNNDIPIHKITGSVTVFLQKIISPQSHSACRRPRSHKALTVVKAFALCRRQAFGGR